MSGRSYSEKSHGIILNPGNERYDKGEAKGLLGVKESRDTYFDFSSLLITEVQTILGILVFQQLRINFSCMLYTAIFNKYYQSCH